MAQISPGRPRRYATYFANVCRPRCWEDPDRGPIYYEASKPLFGGDFKQKKIYRYLAIHIHIIGYQDNPDEGDGFFRALREALTAMKNHAHEPPPGIKAVTSNFMSDAEYFEGLSRNAQDVVSDLGLILAGDENFIRFTGECGDVHLDVNHSRCYVSNYSNTAVRAALAQVQHFNTSAQATSSTLYCGY